MKTADERPSSFRSLLHELRTIPPLSRLILSILATLCLAGLAWWALPHFTDLEKVPKPSAMLKIAVVAFFFPAFFEEVIFRGILNGRQSIRSITISTVLFIVWHPVIAALLVPEALPYMIDPRFLLFVAVFGVAFCLMRRWTGTIWTPVFCHWLLTMLWKGLGGAQFLT